MFCFSSALWMIYCSSPAFLPTSVIQKALQDTECLLRNLE